MTIGEHHVMQHDINLVLQHTRVRIEWAKVHDTAFHDASLKFWVRCLYRRAIDRYHPNLAPGDPRLLPHFTLISKR